MTPEEQLIQRYFDAFNRQDIEGVMAWLSRGAGDRWSEWQALRRSSRSTQIVRI